MFFGSSSASFYLTLSPKHQKYNRNALGCFYWSRINSCVSDVPHIYFCPNTKISWTFSRWHVRAKNVQKTSKFQNKTGAHFSAHLPTGVRFSKILTWLISVWTDFTVHKLSPFDIGMIYSWSTDFNIHKLSPFDIFLIYCWSINFIVHQLSPFDICAIYCWPTNFTVHKLYSFDISMIYISVHVR
jgi:hypothetical protein